MSKVCVLLAEGFEELEAVTILDVLRRAEIETESLSVGNQRVAGAHGIPVLADRTLKEGAGERWDAVILPGGLPGATNLQEDAQVQALVQEQNQGGRTVAAICAAPIALASAGVLEGRAICAAPIALASAGVLEGRRATCYPGFEDQLGKVERSQERVVIDGNVITSRGPGTALDFALTLVEELKGREAADALRDAMLIAR
jgi:4-methyl-5(b-hydroxyethyl)-thiazole monophosphate biosynthesis